MPTAEQVAEATGLDLWDDGPDPLEESGRGSRIWVARYRKWGADCLVRLTISRDFIRRVATPGAAFFIYDLVDANATSNFRRRRRAGLRARAN